jgi:menaquinone-dependent protoporphyrinogen oxidase
VTLAMLDAVTAADVQAHDKVVVGASIRYGHHRPAVRAFAEQHGAVLAARPSAFFSVNIVARKPGKNRPETNPYLRKFLAQVSWRPQLTDVFAGKLDYPRYGFVDRQMIRLIMALTHGPTDPTAVVDFTDWARVEAFAQQVAAL